jgi:hypothetical protein
LGCARLGAPLVALLWGCPQPVPADASPDTTVTDPNAVQLALADRVTSDCRRAELRFVVRRGGAHAALPADRKSTRLNSSHNPASRMPSSA